MKKTIILALVLFLVSFIFLTQPYAQPRGRGGSGWGPGSQYGRMYNPSTVETITGEVVSVDKITPMQGMRYGIHLTVKTDKENISVHLGPGWFIENQDMQIKAKDKVEVKGSRVTVDGKPALIAKEVTKGDSTLVLRDESGFPAWSGWRRGWRGGGGRGCPGCPGRGGPMQP